MAFTINKTDGNILTTIQDGTVDETTNLVLFGKNYAGYGELLNENQVKLLENFANTTENKPDKPIVGQLFYDTTQQQIQVYNGSAFKSVSGSIVSTSTPTVGATGDLWFDSSNEQVYVYNGSQWILIGPIVSAGAGTTGSLSTSIVDNTGTSRSVIEHLINDTLVAITSNDAFTPGTAISGFATISKGINLSTASADYKLHGTATDSDALGGISASSFLRADESDSTSGTLTILNDNSLILGAGSDVTFVQDGDNFKITNTTTDGDIIFNVADNGVDTTALTIDGATTDASFANDVAIAGDLVVTGNATFGGISSFVTTTNTVIEDNIMVLNRGSTQPGYDSGILIDRGVNINVAMIWDDTANEFACISTTDVGAVAGDINITAYQGIHATATAAEYSDLAERYQADSPMEKGDVVKLGGDKEVTKTSVYADEDVFGVVSSNPAYKMNASAGDDSTHPYIALTGRVPCKVKGAVRKGQRLVSSREPGVAQAVIDLQNVSNYAIVGRSLETNEENQVKYVEIVVGRN